MITYETYPFHEVVEYLKSKNDEHYKDLKDKTLYPNGLCVNWEIYETLSKQDLCFTVLMKKDDVNVGYSCYTLGVDLNDNKYVIATNFAIFIEKKYRGKLVIDFIDKCDKILLGKKVSKVLHDSSDVRIGKLLEKSGYEPKSINWIKTL